MEGSLRERPPARTDVGSEFNAWRNATLSLYVVLIVTLAAAPAAAIGMAVSYAIWRVFKPTWLSVALMSVTGVLTVAVLSADVLWWWPWGAMLPDRLFQTLPAGSAVPFGPSVRESMAIETCLGPGLCLALSALLQISERTLTAGIFRQARRGTDQSPVRALVARYASVVPPLAAIQFQDRSHPAHGIRLGADRDNRRKPFDLDVAELRLHTFLPGASGSGKTTTLARIADGAIAAGYGAVVLDCKGGGLRFTAETLAKRHGLPFTLVDAADPDTMGYNPCTGTPSDIANKLVGSFTFGEAGEIYKQVAMSAIPLIVRGLIATGTAVTLRTIADACDENALRLLAKKVEGDGNDPAAVTLADELAGLLGSGDAAAKSGIGSLKYRLGALIQGSFAPLFQAPAIDWDALVQKPTVVYVSLPVTAASEDVALMGRVLVQDIKQVCARRLRAVGTGASVQPVLIAIDEFAGLGEARQIIDLLLQARQAEMPLLLATQKIPDDPGLQNACLQSGLLVVHRLAAKESEDIAAQFGTRSAWKVTQQIDWESGTSQKGSVRDVEEYVVHPNTLRGLKVGEAAVRTVSTDRHAIVLVIPS